MSEEWHPCSSHPEFVKATTDLMKAVEVLSNNVKWIVTIGKGVFAIGLALIVTTILAIFYAGALAERVEANAEALGKLQAEYNTHLKDRTAHHD